MFRRTIIISAVAIAFLATSLYAHRARGRAGDRGFAPQKIEKLQQKLNLTDAQVNGIRALAENRRQQLEQMRQELQPKRQALRQTMQQANPNPSDVGTAALALKDTRQQAKEINQRFLLGVKGLLTPEQLQKLPKRFQ